MLFLAGFAHAESLLATVAVDLTGLDDATYKRLDGLSLEKRLVLRLVQDGFAVVTTSAPADVHLWLTSAEATLTLHGKSRSLEDSRDVAVSDEPLAELHLELAQKAAELAKACTPPPPVAPPPPRPPPRLSPLTVGGGLGVTFRNGGLDPTAKLAVRYGRLLGGELIVGVTGSRGAGVFVLEGQLLAGVSLHLELPYHLVFDAGLCIGAWLHTFLFDDAAASPRSGASVGFAGVLPLTFTFWPIERFGLGLRVTPGISAGQPEHQPEWFRGPASLDAAGVVFLRL